MDTDFQFDERLLLDLLTDDRQRRWTLSQMLHDRTMLLTRLNKEERSRLYHFLGTCDRFIAFMHGEQEQGNAPVLAYPMPTKAVWYALAEDSYKWERYKKNPVRRLRKFTKMVVRQLIERFFP